MHSVWFEDIFYDWFSCAKSLKSAGTVGAGVQYLSYGGIRETDENGLKKDEFKPNDIAATFS